MRDLVILGAGGHGRETLDVVEAINLHAPTWNFLGFLDDGDVVADRLERRHAKLLGPTDHLQSHDAAYVIGIGSASIRAKLDGWLTTWGREPVTLIHPLASVASDNRINEGVVIAAGARVTTNVTLGRHVHINLNSVISHDCVLGDYCQVSPGVNLNGEVHLGERVFLGTGAVVTPGISIGDDAVIGAGAVVVRDVPSGVTVKGVPGRW